MKRAFSRKNLWDRTPPLVKRGVGRLLGAVPLPWLLGPSFVRNLRFVDESQWWPAERIREYQVERLREVCALAWRKSPHYRRVFDEARFRPEEIRSPEDVRHLPFLDRKTVSERLEEMCVFDPGDRSVDYITTAGTSGTPLRFYIQAGRSAVEFAYLVSGWGRVGYRPGATLAVLRGRTIAAPRGGAAPHEYDPVLRHHYYSTFHMDDDNMGRYLDHMRGIGPFYLHAYPSSVANLARFVRRSGREVPSNLLGILAESENVYPEQRGFVTDVFRTRYFSSYGHTEKIVAAAECHASADYHVWPTYGHFELVGADGRAVTTPGERGEIVGTGFINSAVPFIRYRTGDYATYLGDRCAACGREHARIGEIRGHNVQENLVARDGSMITWSAVNMHDDTFDRVNRFQFRQEVPGKALLLVEAAPGFGEAELRRISENLSRKFDGRLDFSVEVVAAVPLSGRGKSVYVDQRIPGAALPSGYGE